MARRTLLPLAVFLWLAAAAKLAATGPDVWFYDDRATTPQRVFAYVPDNYTPMTPVIIVMHGTRRNADDYRDQWQPFAEQYRFILLCPEFTRGDFPGARGYNLGLVRNENGEPNPPKWWAYKRIEPIFQAARERYGLETDSFGLYGHSAGSQFVHRMVFFAPEASFGRIVAANAGWYTLPHARATWPYGLDGVPHHDKDRAAYFAQPMTILLGTKDTDPNHRSLRRAPEAMAQGPHRFARGHHFFATAKAEAEALGVPFNWELRTVEGVDHDNARMAPAAAAILMEAIGRAPADAAAAPPAPAMATP